MPFILFTDEFNMKIPSGPSSISLNVSKVENFRIQWQ